MAQPLYNNVNSSGSHDEATDIMDVQRVKMEIQQQ